MPETKSQPVPIRDSKVTKPAGPRSARRALIVAATALMLSLLALVPTTSASAQEPAGDPIVVATLTQAQLDGAMATWAANAPASYVYSYRTTCFCPYLPIVTVTVVNGVVISAVDQNGNSPSGIVLSVPGMFAEIQDGIDNADNIIGYFDTATGRPLSYYINWDYGIADEETNRDMLGFVEAVGPLTCGNQMVTVALTDGPDYYNGTASVIPGGVTVIAAFGGGDIITLGSGRDIVCAGDGNDIVRAGNGDDLVYGGLGDDVMYGELGNDKLIGGSGVDTLMGQGGADHLRGGGGADILLGGSGADRIDGEAGADRAWGGIGSDVMFGGAGSDRLFGGSGFDVLVGQQGNDRLAGGGHADRIYGGDGNDLVRGNGGHDILFGDSGADVLLGDSGDDSLYPGPGQNVVDGGVGNDVCSPSVYDTWVRCAVHF